MQLGEPEDERDPFRAPLPPADRVWRHPSEFAGSRLPNVSPRHRIGSIVVATGVVASLLSGGLVMVAISLLDRSGAGWRPVERQMVEPVVSRPGAIEEIIERVRPAIARVQAGADRSGSGVIFRSDGHLLTNAHVVERADDITVILANGTELAARLVGTDPDTDAAVLKIEGDSFPVATLGTAANLRVGQQAIAVGSPLGLVGGPSVTAGVVSALHRSVRTGTTDRMLFDMVQTDTAISPGSSGGALLDGYGSVIGLTTAIGAGEPGVEGFAFATPIDVVRSVADDLITTGRARSIWLGIQGNDLDGTTALRLDVDGGALVSGIQADSPAARCGLATSDVIVSVDKDPVASMSQLVMSLRQHRPGDTVAIEVVRDGQHRFMSAVLAERPPDQ